MIIFDSLKDRKWNGRGISISGNSLIVYKNAEFSHKINISTGKFKIKIIGQNRTGSCSFGVKIMSDDGTLFLDQKVSFAKSLSEKTIDFEIKYLVGSVNLIIYRKKDDYGSLDIGRIILDKEEIVIIPNKIIKNNKTNNENVNIYIRDNKKYKIGFIVPYQIYGGAEVYLTTLVNNLRLDFFDIHIIYLKQNPLENFIRNKEVIHKKISTNEHFLNYLLVQDFNYLVYYNSRQVYDLCQEFIKNNSRTKLVEIYHSDFIWSDALAKTSERNCVDFLFSVSPRLMGKITGVKNKVNLPVPIEIEKFEEAKYQQKPFIKFQNERKIIGTVARLSKEKNIDYILDLAKNTTKYNFVILGDGKEEVRLKDRVSKEEIQNLIFLGFKRDAFRYYYSFDAFLLTSQMEGTPISILESMISGIPIFTTNVGEISTIVKDSETGYFLTGDIKKDLSIIDYNISNQKTLLNAKNYVQEFHDAKKVAEIFTNEILKIKKLYIFKKNFRVLPGEYI